MDRRSFLSSLGAVAVAPTLAACARGASTADSTGPMAQSAARLPLGVQLYTVRSEMAKSVEQTLARLAQLGYREVEFAGYYGRTPAQVKAALAAAGLTAPSAHLGLDLLTGEKRAQTLADAAAIGHEWVVLPWLAPNQRGGIDGYKRLATTMNDIASAAQQAGLKFAYHNHDFELTPVEGQLPLEVLMAETDAARVKFELDVYWTVKAGTDPLAFLNAHPGRIAMLHLKDATAAPAREMASVGAGTIDWAAVLARGIAKGTVSHAFVEHDNPSDVWASVSASAAWLKGQGLVASR